jgi:two-component system, NarL family, response regulator DevR
MDGQRRGPIRVALVDDHPLVRSAVRQALLAPDVELIGEAATAEEALTIVPSLRPDVLLLDIGLPGMSGTDLVRELAPRLPNTRFVMLTVSTDEDDVVDAIDHGASGFLTKDVAPDALLRSVRAAHDGDLVVPRRMAARLVRRLSDRSRQGARAGDLVASLTARENEVVRRLADGFTDREIAESLTLSIRTVETHVSSILRKMGVHNRREAARRYRDDR